MRERRQQPRIFKDDGYIQVEPQKLDALLLPAVGKTHDGSYFILARIKDNKALIQDVTTGQAQSVSLTMLAVMWTGELLHLTKRAGLLDDKTRFGFRWFIPALIKYRNLFSDVLLASFFIQLVGLATPIFVSGVHGLGVGAYIKDRPSLLYLRWLCSICYTPNFSASSVRCQINTIATPKHCNRS